MMLCVPRSVSPIDVRQAAAKGPPATPARSKLFTRNKDASSPTKPPLQTITSPFGPSNTSGSSVSATSSTACSDTATTITEDGGVSHSPGPTTPVSMSKRTGSKWLASLRSPSSSKQRPSARDVVAGGAAELATSAQALETGIISAASGTPSTPSSPSTGRRGTLNKEAQPKVIAGNVVVDFSETSNANSIGTSGGKTLSSFLGSLTKKPKEPVEPAAAAATTRSSSRPTPSPLPLQQRDMPSVDLQSESEEDEEETEDEDDDFADVSLDVYPNSQPSVFYPSSSTNHHHHHHHHLHGHHRPSSAGFQIPEPLSNGGPRKPPQPLRSHINLLQLTTLGLLPSPSPHPLITAPRSSAPGNGGGGGGGGGNAGSSSSSNGAPLFPRSCNTTRQLPPARSVLATLHKTRIICRLESPGSLTAAEELSIMPFATRLPGSHRGGGGGDRSSSNPANAMYPSSSYRNSNYRSSLMRNLALEDGDLIREVDVNAGGGGTGVQGNHHYPTFSKGLKRWLSRPPFEQRVVVWTPASHASVDLGIIRSAVHRPALMGPAPLEFSEGVEALAGIVRPRRVAWQIGSGRSRASVSQVVAPLHHPKPTSFGMQTLVIPPPPLLSSSPSSTTSTDTSPNTPGSNSSSHQNLTSFVSPAFLKRLRQSSIPYVDPNISDEDDVPLGVVVINKRSDDRNKPVSSPSKDDPQERARRLKEKEIEKEKRKLKDAERKKAFKEQVLSSRIRREAHRASGRYRPTSLSQDWIEVDTNASPSPPLSTTDGRGSSSAPSGTSRQQRSQTVSAAVPTNSSAQSIRSQSSARSRSASVRPPSVVDSERSYQTARSQSTQHQSQQHHHHRQSSGSMGMMPMMTAPIMVYNPPYAAVGNGNCSIAMPTPPYPPQFFAPPPPTLPVPATRSSKSSNASRRDSGYGEFGLQMMQQQQQQQQQKSLSAMGQQFFTMPSRRSSKSDAERTNIATMGRSSASQHGLLPPRPRFASNASNDSSSDTGNNSSSSLRSAGGRSANYASSRRSSLLVPPMLVGRNIN